MAATVQADSFLFCGVDVLLAYGVRCVGHDALLPELRRRAVTVPARDGAYDFGANRYEGRKIRLDCDTTRGLTRQEIREMAALLAKKGRLVLWDEPDKHYVGRVYRQTELKYLGMAGHEFVLEFECEPFAYGQSVTAALEGPAGYAGTARTPTRVRVTNMGEAALDGLVMRIRKRRDL